MVAFVTTGNVEVELDIWSVTFTLEDRSGWDIVEVPGSGGSSKIIIKHNFTHL